MRFLYLHGFASSPHSRKARLFADNLQKCGISLEIPDLAANFETLTVTSQLRVVEKAVEGQPVVLIGSSLGGYLAALYSAQHAEVNRLLLLAPAFDFSSLWLKELGPVKLAEWRKKGRMNVYHYGMGHETSLGIQLLDDAGNYPAFPDFHQPCLILHGTKDPVVPFSHSERFAAAHPATTKLLPFGSGHDLVGVLDEIWNSSRDFLVTASL